MDIGKVSVCLIVLLKLHLFLQSCKGYNSYISHVSVAEFTCSTVLKMRRSANCWSKICRDRSSRHMQPTSRTKKYYMNIMSDGFYIFVRYPKEYTHKNVFTHKLPHFQHGKCYMVITTIEPECSKEPNVQRFLHVY